MRPSCHLILLAAAAIGVHAASSPTMTNCNADNCLRAVRATSFPTRHGVADCSAYYTSSSHPIPTYASACSGAARYKSACSCVGVTSTAPSPTSSCGAFQLRAVGGNYAGQQAFVDYPRGTGPPYTTALGFSPYTADGSNPTGTFTLDSSGRIAPSPNPDGVFASVSSATISGNGGFFLSFVAPDANGAAPSSSRFLKCTGAVNGGTLTCDLQDSAVFGTCAVAAYQGDIAEVLPGNTRCTHLTLQVICA